MTSDIFDKTSKVNSIFKDWQYNPSEFHFLLKAIAEAWQSEEDELRKKHRQEIIAAKSQMNLF